MPNLARRTGLLFCCFLCALCGLLLLRANVQSRSTEILLPPLALDNFDDAPADRTSSATGEALNEMNAEDVTGEASRLKLVAAPKQRNTVKESRIKTLFTLPESFIHWQPIGKQQLIPTANFLKSYAAMMVIFDKMRSTTFTIVKNDLVDKVQRLASLYKDHPTQLAYVQNFIQLAKQQNQCDLHESLSPCRMLIWLRRSLKLMSIFLTDINAGEPNIAASLSIGYEGSLKPHHSWLLRSLFQVAVKSLPSRKEFLSLLAVSPLDAKHPDFAQTLSADLQLYVAAVDRLIEIMNRLYDEHQLNSDEAA